MNGLTSELLKYKRTFTRKLIVFIPLFFVLYSLVIRLLLPAFFNSWEGILDLVFNWWPFIFLPLGMGVFAVLVAAQERKSGNYHALLSHHITPVKIWFCKVAGMAVYSLLSTLVLSAAVVICGLITSSGRIPIFQILAGSMVCWLSSLVLIPVQLWAATWKGVFLSMGIALAGMFAGVLAAPESYWAAVPWSWATRLMCPIIGVHPNGIVLEPASPLLDSSVIPVGMILSVSTFLLVTVITGIWFNRREVK